MKTVVIPKTPTDTFGDVSDPREVFLLLFRSAIDRSVDMLASAGVDDASIWDAYQSALDVIVRSTLEVNTDVRAAS